MRKKVNIKEIVPNSENPRTISKKNFNKLVKSIKDFPQMLDKRPLVVDEDMVVLGGNMRLKALQKAGVQEVTIDVAEGWTEEQKKEFIVKDNVGFGDWDWDLLANEWDIEKLNEWGLEVNFTEDDVDEKYTAKIVAPTYKPSNKKPDIKDVFDKQKTMQFIEQIKKSKLSDEQKEFLMYASYRHLVFDYSKIADLYAHSDKDMQEMMEKLALIIIDFNKAVENGYVELSKKIADIYKSEGILEHGK